MDASRRPDPQGSAAGGGPSLGEIAAASIHANGWRGAVGDYDLIIRNGSHN